MKPTYIFILVFISLAIHALAEPDDNPKIKLDRIEWKNFETVSGLWVYTDKESFEYDNNGNVLTVSTAYWSHQEGDWNIDSKSSNTYVNGILSQEIKSSFHSTEQVWVDTMKIVFEYENKLLKRKIYYERSSNSEDWKNSAKEEYAYDANGRQTELLFLAWSASENVWENFEKNAYSYDSEGRIIEYTGYVWNFLFGGWDNYDKETYSYGPAEGTEDYIYYTWNILKDSWDNYYKDHQEYMTDGKYLIYESWYWERLSSSWKSLTKEVHEYDAAKNLVRFEEYDWNTRAARWDYYDKEEYIYDSFNNLTTFTDYDKSSTVNVWVKNSKEEYSYNTDVATNDMMLPYKDDDLLKLYFQTQPIQSDIYDWTGTAWKATDQGIFYFSNLALPASELSTQTNLKFYPNPASHELFITGTDINNIKSISLINLKGQRELSWRADLWRLDLTQVEPGIYILEFNMKDGKLLHQKVVKR